MKAVIEGSAAAPVDGNADADDQEENWCSLHHQQRRMMKMERKDEKKTTEDFAAGNIKGQAIQLKAEMKHERDPPPNIYERGRGYVYKDVHIFKERTKRR